VQGIDQHAMPWHQGRLAACRVASTGSGGTARGHVWLCACNVLAATCGYARQWLIAAAPPAMPSERTAEWTVW
jgi:hypothetical protein